MGGSPDMTSPTSWRGAYAAQKALFLQGEGLPVVVRRARDSDRGRQILALRPSLPHVRHDHSFVAGVHSCSLRQRSTSILFLEKFPPHLVHPELDQELRLKGRSSPELAVGAAGRAENTELEARPDVLTYTTPVLDQDVEVVGEVSAEIWFSSSLPHADVFVRLCDVDQDGRSWNVCDGLVSLSDAAEPQGVSVTLWPTA